jgi:transposase
MADNSDGMDAHHVSTAPNCPGCAQRDRRIDQLEARIGQLEQIIEQLRRGGKRQAAPFAKGPPKLNPRKPGRKRGEDYGTKAFRAAPPVIHENYEAPLPNCCPHCGGGDLQYQRTTRQYQTEIPTEVIHRRFHIAVGRCACCGQRVRGRHRLQTSDAVGCCASQLGPNAQALIVHLNKELGLSQGKISRLLQTCFNLKLTRGGACQAMLRAGRRCEADYLKIVRHVQQSDWAVADETGWRIGGWNAWLHTAVTKHAAAYRIDPRRGFDAAKRLLGAEYAGTLIHDGWAAYRRFLDATHQTCLAHLLRRCKELLELATRGAVIFPRKVKAILLEALAVRDGRDAEKLTTAQAARRADALQARLVKLITPTKTHAVNQRFAAHLFHQQDHLFTFLRREGIDATNWRAEQALRPAVVNRKVWGGNRTDVGADAQSVLMTVWQTAQRRHLEPMRWLSHLLRSPALAPPLLPVAGT